MQHDNAAIDQTDNEVAENKARKALEEEAARKAAIEETARLAAEVEKEAAARKVLEEEAARLTAEEEERKAQEEERKAKVKKEARLSEVKEAPGEPAEFMQTRGAPSAAAMATPGRSAKHLIPSSPGSASRFREGDLIMKSASKQYVRLLQKLEKRKNKESPAKFNPSASLNFDEAVEREIAEEEAVRLAAEEAEEVKQAGKDMDKETQSNVIISYFSPVGPLSLPNTGGLSISLDTYKSVPSWRMKEEALREAKDLAPLPVPPGSSHLSTSTTSMPACTLREDAELSSITEVSKTSIDEQSFINQVINSGIGLDFSTAEQMTAAGVDTEVHQHAYFDRVPLPCIDT